MHVPRTILLQQLDSALWQGRWASSAHSWADCCAKAQTWTSESMFEATLHITDQVPLRKASENLKGFFFFFLQWNLQEIPTYSLRKILPYVLEPPFLPWLCMYKHVRSRRDLCGLLPLEIHFTRSGSLKQKSRAQQKAKKSHLVTWVFLCVFIFPILSLHWRTGGVIWPSSSFHTLPVCINLFLPSLTLYQLKGHGYTQALGAAKLWSKQDGTFSQWEEECLCSTVRGSGLQSDQPQCDMRTAPWLLAPRPGSTGLVAHPRENWGFGSQFLSQAFRPVSFWNSETNREDLGLCCTHFKMSTVSNASRKEVSVNRLFSFLPFASLQFLFQ